MIVGFSKHGTGNGYGPTRYMTDQLRPGRECSPPQVVRGDEEKTRRLIDSLEFKNRYTSGVLSFAHDEVITPEMEQAIMDRFESLAFAGLSHDQYDILWVRHTHAGHHELHFVTPRVELSTGKSFNIKPPGERTKQHFDDFRSEINARYGLADPTDPDRAKNVSTPGYELKIASEAIRGGQKAPSNMRELIDGVLTQRAVQGLIRSREDVLEHLKELGFDTTRTGKDYITVNEAQSGQRWRLKGALYARDFEPSCTIEKSDAARERDYTRPDEETAQRYAKRVEQHIAARAGYNQNRYSKPESKHRLDHIQEQVFVANSDGLKPLSRHLWRELGDNAILHKRDSQAPEERRSLGPEGREDPVQLLREPPMREDRRESTHLSGRLQDSEGVLNDGVRNTLAERLEAFGAAIQRAASSVRASTKRLADDVRAYFTGEQELASASQLLEQSGRQLEQRTPAIWQALQHEQALDKQRNRSRSGFSLER